MPSGLKGIQSENCYAKRVMECIKPLKPSLGSYVTFLGSEHSARLLPGPQAVSNPLPTHIPPALVSDNISGCLLKAHVISEGSMCPATHCSSPEEILQKSALALAGSSGLLDLARQQVRATERGQPVSRDPPRKRTTRDLVMVLSSRTAKIKSWLKLGCTPKFSLNLT
ncbi:hypothetical protein D623_10004283 [Myotis brandtii]|uniref:Uncharacterized protein n=1 Tax=Myotis brandtii TaxID=109478 RepID=S7MEB9_MYOBR|nr:hypothetical protein D623_10004283 [Myotis brandtii]